MTAVIDRRSVLAAIALMLGGCAPYGGMAPGAGFYPFRQSEFASAYGPIIDQGHEIPAVDLTKIDPDLVRQHVRFAGPYRPGTIVVNVSERRLYLVQPGGMAIRYAVGVGREEALNFRGSAVIGRKAEWPHWTPTGDIIRRMPIYAHYVNGLPGGIGNPLGARALYLYRGNQDTYFRLHGTNEPDTIGTKVSSGCIRLFNHDIIDLYNRVPVGAPVVVLQEGRVAAQRQRRGGRLFDRVVMDRAATERGVMQPVVMDRVLMDRPVMERAVIGPGGYGAGRLWTGWLFYGPPGPYYEAPPWGQ